MVILLILGIDPRLAATFKITDWLRLQHALGVAHQAPSFVVPVPGFQVAGLERGLQRGVQTSAGVEVDVASKTTASLTLFQNALFNLTDQLSLLGTPVDDDLELDGRSRGHSLGLEFLLRRPLSQRFGGLVAYTLSRSFRWYRGFSGPAAFDRTHVLQVAGGYDLGRKWRAASRFVVYTGIPTGRDERYPMSVPTSDPAGGTSDGWQSSQVSHSARRTEPFYRVDVRLQKRWRIGTAGAYWGLVFEVLNATLNEEVMDINCDETGCRDERIGPITVPSIGVEGAF